MHNMMVEVWVESDEVESADMYTTVFASESKSCGVSLEDDTNIKLEELEAKANGNYFDRKLK